MFTSVDNFLTTWNYEKEATLKLLNALTDASILEPKNANCRTIGTLGNHIAETLAEMPHKMGLRDNEEYTKQATVAGLVAAYTKLANEVDAAVRSKWTDASLLEETDMYGEKWKNGFSLSALVMHQAHHRGQLTTLMRLAGLKVPGIYGPAKEEWAAIGMEAPE